MLGTIPVRSQVFSRQNRADSRTAVPGCATPGNGRLGSDAPVTDRWQVLSDSVILVLGFPRSGTTWLAKIFDSHPDVMYRHEPDELILPTLGLQPAAQIREWVRQRGLRVAVKRPNFRKSWRPAPLNHLRQAIAAALFIAERIGLPSPAVRRIGVPDLVAPHRWGSVRATVKLVNWDGAAAARTMPKARCVFIVRHPCGQIASVMAGVAAKRFGTASTDDWAPVDLKAGAAWAKRHGVDEAAFAKLPDAAKYAWSWRAFNEPAIDALRNLPNARVVVYEDLCRNPEAVSRELFDFAGLDWQEQSAGFLGVSTRHDQPSGYFDVFRSTGQVADRWRRTMSVADQEAVRTVLSTSALARCWPGAAA